MKRYLIILMSLAVCGQCAAQGGVAGFFKKVGAFIDTMSVKGLDSNYIDAPEKPWQIIVKGNVNQSVLKMETSGEILGVKYKASPKLTTEPASYVGVWAGYRGYGIGYTVNVGGDKGSYFTIGATGGAYGVNLRIHSFENDNPEFDVSGDLGDGSDVDKDKRVKLMEAIRCKTVIADAYYMFNGKRFSYAAAYDQSVVQKRSAGSLMVGAMFYYAHTDYAKDKNGDLIYMMHGLGRMKMWQGSLGVGYAFNWVPARGLLVSAMAMPMLTVVNREKRYNYSTNVEQLMDDPKFDDPTISDAEREEWWYSSLRITPAGKESYNSGLAVNFDARLSLTYNFGRFFANAYGQFYNFRYHHDDSRGYLNDWFVNASFGIRL